MANTQSNPRAMFCVPNVGNININTARVVAKPIGKRTLCKMVFILPHTEFFVFLHSDFFNLQFILYIYWRIEWRENKLTCQNITHRDGHHSRGRGLEQVMKDIGVGQRRPSKQNVHQKDQTDSGWIAKIISVWLECSKNDHH